VSEYLNGLINLIDELDHFGQMGRELSLTSIAIGTLRKDKEIAKDISKLVELETSGYGALALSRIITEDYLHLLFLNNSGDKLAQNIQNFNSHPIIDHYSSMKAMLSWGYPFTDQERAIFPQIEEGFEANKDNFLRHGRTHDPFDADSYYRTWTKLNLDALIAKTGLVEDDESRSLHFIKETYGSASTVIHNNAAIIWNFVNAGSDIESIDEGWLSVANSVSYTNLSKLIHLTLNILNEDPNIQINHEEELLKLEAVMDTFPAVRPL